MKLITENIEDIQILTEEKDGKEHLYIEGVFLQSEIKNRNGRIYPFSVLENTPMVLLSTLIVCLTALHH
jgi:hypothetical protein